MPDRRPSSDLPGLADPPFRWPEGRRLYVLARDIWRRDAVGNFCFDLAALFQSAGIPTTLHAENYDATDPADIRPIAEAMAEMTSEDVVFFNFSTEDPILPELVARPCRKIVYYHGITPARFFAGTDPRTEEIVRRGYAQLPLAARFDVAMANSRASAAVLREAAPGPAPVLDDAIIAPPMLGLRRWEAVAAEPVALPEARRLMLFVGRLVPHKGILPLLETFRALRTLDPSWALALVGAPADGFYGRLIENYLAEHRAVLDGRIALLHGLSNGALKSVYERADLFVSLSEHEGFCVPLVEAMGFDLPIAARAEPAMAEVLGDGGLLLTDTRPEDIARALTRLMDDAQGLARLAERRRQRHAELSGLASGVPIWRAVEKALSLDARPL